MLDFDNSNFPARKEYTCLSHCAISPLYKPAAELIKDYFEEHSKSGINAVNLKELLGFGSYGTAWTWLQKLRRCTIRDQREKLSGRIEVDEFFIGGQRSGKPGRGAGGKTIIAVAVER